MKTHNMAIFLLILILSLSGAVHSDDVADDAAALNVLKQNIKNVECLGWSDLNPCNWVQIHCDEDNRVRKIDLKHLNLQGTLPEELGNLTAMEKLEVQNNSFSGPFPKLKGLENLTLLHADNNMFTSFPTNFFLDKVMLEDFKIDNNPFMPWTIPESIEEATTLMFFSANNASIGGEIPIALGKIPTLLSIKLSDNYLQGELPSSFSEPGSLIQVLQLNGQKGITKLNGSISVLAQMWNLTSVSLQGNQFTGPIPDLSNLTALKDVNFRENQLTGVVPLSFVNLTSLRIVNLTNNLLQGPTPRFGKVQLDLKPGTNRFCSPVPSAACDSNVNLLLSVAETMGYPTVFAEKWKRNNPCNIRHGWMGITCVRNNISAINFTNMGLSGSISPMFSSFTSLQTLVLAGNSFTGTIPIELTKLPNLQLLDVSNNNLYGTSPAFRIGVVVNTTGNPNFGKGLPPPPLPSSASDTAVHGRDG